MIRYLLPLALLATLLGACRPELSFSPSGQGVDFNTFYQRFLSDSSYQLAHIIFPLEGIPANAEPEDLQGYHWPQADWQLHRPFAEGQTAFQSEWVHVDSNLVIELITHRSGAYGMERRFGRLGDDWYLIYYVGMNPIK